MKFSQVLFFLFISFLGFSQQTKYVDFKTAKVEIGFSDKGEIGVGGFISYEFDILKDIDSIFIDAKGFDLIYCSLDKEEQDSIYDGKKFTIKHSFKAKNTHKLEVFWSINNPKKAIYFIDWKNNDSLQDNRQVWTQGQGKYTSNWMPSIDDMNEKIEFDINITYPPKGFEVISNGKLIEKDTTGYYNKWHYDMQNPMSSYLVALAIGKYNKKVAYSNSGIPLEMYFYPEDSLKFEPTYRYTKQLFDFLEDEIGVPYPWQNYKMVPVKDFLYAGMENTSLNIYSDAFVVDSIAFVDKNFVNINAHELAHQWFGNLVTATSGTHHWLQEGFATYYALLAEREVFGDEYYYWRLYEYAQELVAQDKAGGSTSLLDPKSSSTTFYKKGAWVLHLLREKVGDIAFKKGVKRYLKKHQFKNVETDDFISEVETASGANLDEFVKVWLESEKLPKVEIKFFDNSFGSYTISKNDFAIPIKFDFYKWNDKNNQGSLISSEYQTLISKKGLDIFDHKAKSIIPNPSFDKLLNIRIEDTSKGWFNRFMLSSNFLDKIFVLDNIEQIDERERIKIYNHVLSMENNIFLRKKTINLLGKELFLNKSIVFKTAFNLEEIKIRQAIAQSLLEIPSELKTDYESLLNDKSYITIETALFNLWKNFPEDRHKYLDKTKEIQGFNNKNVRILWLTLALITDDYQPENKTQYFKELTDYTSPKYGFEVRQNAFQYLNEIKACNDDCNKNLQQAAKHHNWRFKKFAQSLLGAE
ncbi:M1 family metallopeptidase [Algibacter sp. 2305UL17-15]|uniref:M1 family metallopeptidase n=1 Tax=Algibacter sp. 2305UL17-15 TaxID=3231268 RepID=UPI00345AD41C